MSEEANIEESAHIQTDTSESETKSLIGAGKPLSAMPACVVACISALQFGYSTAVMSAALHPILDSFYGPSSDSADVDDIFASLSSSGHHHGASAFIQGVLVSSILVGALIGALISGTIADKIGRRPTLFVDELLFTIGAVLCGVSKESILFITGRVVLGFGVGIASAIPSLLGSECSVPSSRGSVGVVNQLMVTCGILLAYASGAGLAKIKGSLGWRIMVTLPVAISIIHILLVLLWRRTNVESPRWLLLKGRKEDAKKMLQKLRGPDYDAEAELESMIAAQEELAKEAGNESDDHGALWHVSHPLRPLIIAVGLQFWQQITGINAVLYYLSTFLQCTGMNEEMSNLMSIVVGAVNVAMTFASIPLIEKLGRKPLIFISLVGMCLTLAGIGIIDLFMATTNAASIVSVVLTVLFVISFAVGMGCVPLAVCNEIFDNKARGTAVSISMATNWIMNLSVSLLFPVLVDLTRMGYVFIGFAVFAVCGIIFTAILQPETKGKSFEQISALFR